MSDRDMNENAKQEVLTTEGDSYFKRNLSDGKIEVAQGCILFDDFLSRNIHREKSVKILEVGCCYGYNLMYLCGKHGFEGYGIEPSAEAVEYGNHLISTEAKHGIILKQGTADSLSFDSEYFDIVMLAFCMFWVDRKYLMHATAEADRVLKTGGYLASWDFDTKIPYRRVNVHNSNVPTYKYDLASLFLSNPQYSLIEKRSFSHSGNVFHKNMQERCSLNVLYKDKIEDAYIFD